MSYRIVGDEITCPNPECAEGIVHELYEERPEACPTCERKLTDEDWLDAEPIDTDELFARADPRC